MTSFILGKVEIKEEAVVTHRDSYLIENLSVVSVRRPFFGPAVMVAGALALFTFGFADLLYGYEFVTIGICIIAALTVGAKLGQLKLLSRDLKNTELSGAVWGNYYALQSVRANIVKAVRANQSTRSGLAS